jgi:hypothetical protein
MFDLSELSDWVTSNWFELGTLLIQCTILLALVGFGRAMLRVNRASQEQLEAQQRPSLGLGAVAHAEPRHTEGVFHRAAGSCRRIIRWLQAPAGS